MRHPRRMSRWQDIDYLDLVLERVVGDEPGADPGRIRLLAPRFGGLLCGRQLQRLLRGERRWVRVPLDERGTWLWRRLDGRTPVRDLLDGFAAAFPAEAVDTAQRVCFYLEALVQHGFLRHVNADELTRWRT